MKQKFLITEFGGEYASPFFYKYVGNIASLEKRVRKKGRLIEKSFGPLSKETALRVLPLSEEPLSTSRRKISRFELALFIEFPVYQEKDGEKVQTGTKKRKITLHSYNGTYGLYYCPFIAETRNKLMPALGKDITNDPRYLDSNLAR